jgi:hypothetical protein
LYTLTKEILKHYLVIGGIPLMELINSKKTAVNISKAVEPICKAMMATSYEVQFPSKDGTERIYQQKGFPTKQEIFEKFFEHGVYSPGGNTREHTVIEETISATGTLKQIKGPLAC